MDVRNSFLKILPKEEIEGKKMMSLRFFKADFYEDLFTSSGTQLRKWYERLKKQCVLIKFRRVFRDVKVIGSGNYAKVYLVEKKSSGEQFAVKVFDKSLISVDPMEKKCIRKEVEIQRHLTHKHFVKMEAVYEGDNHVYCVNEYYQGGSLLDRLMKNGVPKESLSIDIMKQILQALIYLDSKKILHRDLKPENVLFRRHGEDEIGIADFGFATFEESYNELFARCGTPGFVAPEVLLDKKYDTKVDVYSAGIILFLMLTGDIPFNSPSYSEIVRKNIKGEVDFAGLKHLKISGWIVDLLKKMLEIDPVKRFSAKESLEFI